MTRKEHLHRRAEVYFIALKQVLQEIERLGERPNLTVHWNGMPDQLTIDPPHPTTPEVDRIRSENRAARLAA